jgi:tRNA(adenine34) deaminase
MWRDLEKPWQDAFSLAWEAYKSGTIPIGAVIVDRYCRTVSVGRNMVFDKTNTNCLAGTYMAHAEMAAMMQLKESEHPDIRDYTLYTTMEPCPMCFGAMLMVHICSLKYAARDGFAGATGLKDKMEYTRNKKMDIERGCEDLEAFQIVLQTVFEYGRQHRRMEDILSKWEGHCPGGVRLGRELFEKDYFKYTVEHDVDISVIYDDVVTRYKNKAAGTDKSAAV